VIIEWLLQLFDALPAPVAVMALAFSPIGEVRVSIPVAILHFDMGWGEAIVWSLIGNILVAPVATWFYRGSEHLLRRSERGARTLDRLWARTRRKQSTRIKHLEEAAVALFIAIPLPGSGAWSGVLVAHVFGLEWRKTWSYFYAGVVASTFLVAGLVVTGRWAL
jgi:uncharacterized membrane protein